MGVVKNAMSWISGKPAGARVARIGGHKPARDPKHVLDHKQARDDKQARHVVPDTPEGRALWARVTALPFWFHSIDLGNGIITPGHKTPAIHQQELASFQLPEMRGKSVLDIGAWDGFYSFEAERRGAARVVALDKYVWALDWDAKRIYHGECKKQGVLPQPYHLVPEVWRFDELPGQRGFKIAHEVLQSRVETVVGDLMTVDLQTFGQFDIVFYLGVLYHVENPLAALQRLRQVTKQVAIIETEAAHFGGFETTPLCEFFPTKAKLGNDPTNFWAPNAPALVSLCEAAGFRNVQLLTAPPTAAKGIARYRLIAHAFV